MSKHKLQTMSAISDKRSDMWRKDILLYKSFSQGALTKLNDVISTLEMLDENEVTDFFLSYLDHFYSAIIKERDE